jgi:hypothetical protein
LSQFQATHRAKAPRSANIGQLYDMLGRWKMEAACAGISGRISNDHAIALIVRLEAQTARLDRIRSAAQ